MDTTKLSRYFSALVRAEFDSATLAEIVRRNATPAYAGSCATHDYIDANALMYGAFLALTFRKPDFSSEADARAMGDAWDMSHAADFAN